MYKNEDKDDGSNTWESLTSTNSFVDVARCNVGLERDKASVLNRLVQMTRGELPHLLFPPSVPPARLQPNAAYY